MAFDLENKIRWEELSPSLQDKFVQIWGSDGESVMPIHNITEIWKQIKKNLSSNICSTKSSEFFRKQS